MSVYGRDCDSVIASRTARGKAAWARLIRKVYEAGALDSPKCKGPLRVIAVIEYPEVIRRILEHLGLWAPQVKERSPPLGSASCPRHARLPLTYTRFPTSPELLHGKKASEQPGCGKALAALWRLE